MRPSTTTPLPTRQPRTSRGAWRRSWGTACCRCVLVSGSSGADHGAQAGDAEPVSGRCLQYAAATMPQRPAMAGMHDGVDSNPPGVVSCLSAWLVAMSAAVPDCCAAGQDGTHRTLAPLAAAIMHATLPGRRPVPLWEWCNHLWCPAGRGGCMQQASGTPPPRPVHA